MILDLSLSGDGANGAVDGLRSSWQNGGLGGSGLPAVQDVTITQRADDGEALQSVCMCAKCGGSFGHVYDGAWCWMSMTLQVVEEATEILRASLREQWSARWPLLLSW